MAVDTKPAPTVEFCTYKAPGGTTRKSAFTDRLMDPRWLARTGVRSRACIPIAGFPPEQPGEPPRPLRWSKLPMASIQPPPIAEPLPTVAPGAIWKGVAPFVDESMADGSYRIRGKMDSPRIVIEAKKT